MSLTKVQRECIGGPLDGLRFWMASGAKRAVIPMYHRPGLGQFVYYVGRDGLLYPEDDGGRRHEADRRP